MIEPTLVQLRMMREVARHGTMASAAETLGYTPSAISQQLNQLERSAEVDLFERVGRNVHLTDAGYDLATRADDILSRVEAASIALEEATTQVRGEVHVGLFESVAVALLPRLLTSLASSHPDLSVHTSLVEHGGPSAALLSGELDLGFAIEYDGLAPSLPRRLSSDHVHTDPFRLVVPDGDPIEGPTVALDEVADRPFIGSSTASSCGRLVLAACAAAGFRPDVVHQFDDYTTALRLVAAGHGVSLVPDLGLCDVPPGVRVLDLAEPVERRIMLSYRTVSAERPAVRAVRDALCDLLCEPRAAA